MGEFEGSKYYVSDHVDNWPNARIACENAGGHLAVVQSQAENDFIQNNANAPSGSVWIGLTDENSEGTFEWVTGDAVTYTNWATSEPSGNSGEDYTRLRTNDGYWTDRTIDYSYEYVLEIPCASNDPCANAPNTIPGFTLLGEFNNSKYYAASTAATWDAAQADCAANGGHLVVINDQAENDFIFNNMSTATGSIWTG